MTASLWETALDLPAACALAQAIHATPGWTVTHLTPSARNAIPEHWIISARRTGSPLSLNFYEVHSVAQWERLVNL